MYGSPPRASIDIFYVNSIPPVSSSTSNPSSTPAHYAVPSPILLEGSSSTSELSLVSERICEAFLELYKHFVRKELHIFDLLGKSFVEYSVQTSESKYSSTISYWLFLISLYSLVWNWPLPRERYLLVSKAPESIWRNGKEFIRILYIIDPTFDNSTRQDTSTKLIALFITPSHFRRSCMFWKTADN